MYSTRFDHENRYVVTCITNQDKSNVRLVDTIVDTGAKYTCYCVGALNRSLREQDFSNSRSIRIGGLIRDEGNRGAVTFYEYHVKQFTIGSIDMGERCIWITFDRRVKDNVLGMDILQSISFMQEADERTLHFFQNKDEMKEYVSN